MKVYIEIFHLKLLNLDSDGEDKTRNDNRVPVGPKLFREESGHSGGKAFNSGGMEYMTVWDLKQQMVVLEGRPLRFLDVAHMPMRYSFKMWESLEEGVVWIVAREEGFQVTMGGRGGGGLRLEES